MNEQPLISVIVPVYKVEAYLDQCIRSIVGQTYRNLEILLVDDGSPDRSGEICDEWAARDSRIRVIHKENGGAGLARNVALDAAKGDLIAFVDSDDYIAPEMFSYLYSLMADGADIAECAYVETAENDAAFPKTADQTYIYDRRQAMEAHIQDTVFRQLIWNKLYRRAVVGNVRFPVGTKIDDEFFTYRVLMDANKLVLSDRVCYAYRQQPDSIMHQRYSLKRLEGLTAKRQRLELLKEKMPELVPLAREELLMACLYGMQGTLKHLSGEDKETAKSLIHRIAAKNGPVPMDRENSMKRKLLLFCAQRWLEPTAKVLNFLIDIHILS